MGSKKVMLYVYSFAIWIGLAYLGWWINKQKWWDE